MNKFTWLYIAWTFGLSFASWFIWWLVTKIPCLKGLNVGDFQLYWAGFNESFMKAAGIGLAVLLVVGFINAQSAAEKEKEPTVTEQGE